MSTSNYNRKVNIQMIRLKHKWSELGDEITIAIIERAIKMVYDYNNRGNLGIFNQNIIRN